MPKVAEKWSRKPKDNSVRAATAALVRAEAISIAPTYDRVLLEFDEPECKTAGGLFIPDKVQVESKQKQGVARFATVLAVGPGRFLRKKPDVRRPMTLKPGDRVACPALNFPIKMGTKKATDWRTGITTVQGREVYLVNEDAVVGIL
jgi:co-chaperonin GroES (HSP10)